MTFIVLTQAHTHAGTPYKAGERLDVDSSSADWLIANGVARHDRQPDPAPSPEGGGKPTEPKPTTSHRKEPKS
ncbi:hypothetical protein EBQ34_03100 [Vandammella animalimorsus]|uniref:DUF7210 domain-containing protein n=1 Tax=Vandammella animalimorsus TaxID=2029117 RepID=A0A3M6RT33_9BURK|nr:hypothetical protein [Vandammella animalimorsus]RMX18064.1 hypothetical protein EBQ34_03100 [Vandammella animalimorsus]